MTVPFDEHMQHYTGTMQFMDAAWDVQRRFDEWWDGLTDQERIIVTLRYINCKFGEPVFDV